MSIDLVNGRYVAGAHCGHSMIPSSSRALDRKLLKAAQDQPPETGFSGFSNRIVRLLLPLLLSSTPVLAQPPKLAISLAQAELEAIGHSPILKAAKSNLAAAQAQVDAQFALLLPKLTAQGNYAYQTEVPMFHILPTAPVLQFGSHDTYSAGAALSYNFFDAGALRNAWKSQKFLANSQDDQVDLIRRQVLLMTRLDYFQVRLALESERSLTDSMRLAAAQFHDINIRYRAGSASRIDWLSAREQVLDRDRDLRGAQADVATALRTLFAQTGQDQGLDVSAPIDERISSPLPEGLQVPTVVVTLDEIDDLVSVLQAASKAAIDNSYPQLLVYQRQADAQRLAAKSLIAGLYPRLDFSFNSTYAYPFVPFVQWYYQNIPSFSASVPLFDGGRIEKLAQAQREFAKAAERQRDEAYDELLRDWHKARDQYAALVDQESVDRQSVKETEEIASLRYASYRSGGSTILDVVTADLNAVESKVTAARRKTQILIQLATLDSLSVPSTPRNIP